MTETSFDFVLRVLRLFDEWDGLEQDNLWWRTDGEYAPVTFLVNCNDAFWWATADSERITPDNVAVLEQSLADCKAYSPNGRSHADLLFCCRVRGMRPQGATYKHIEQALWPLFDAAGPPRETDRKPFGNPTPHPAEAVTP